MPEVLHLDGVADTGAVAELRHHEVDDAGVQMGQYIARYYLDI